MERTSAKTSKTKQPKPTRKTLEAFRPEANIGAGTSLGKMGKFTHPSAKEKDPKDTDSKRKHKKEYRKRKLEHNSPSTSEESTDSDRNELASEASSIDSEEIQTLVFLDLETTGLPETQPKITELCMVAVHRNELMRATWTELPRVLNKLVLCLNPAKPIGSVATKLTRLNINNLSEQKGFDKSSAIAIKKFLERLDPPVCLLAHNGDRFDFPLLRVELQPFQNIFSQDILCADMLLAFQAIDSNGPYNLKAIHQREFGYDPQNSHTAEGDCFSMLRIMLKRADLLPWFDENKKLLTKLPPMYQLVHGQ